MNFFSTFMVVRNSSPNFSCSWSCQVPESALKRACSAAARTCMALTCLHELIAIGQPKNFDRPC